MFHYAKITAKYANGRGFGTNTNTFEKKKTASDNNDL